MFAWQFAKAQYTADLHGWTRFISMQNHYNLVYREEEREMIPFCIRPRRGLDPLEPNRRADFSPETAKRGGGGETRPPTPIHLPTNFTSASRLYSGRAGTEDCRRHGFSGPQIALAWMLHKPHISAPIIRASKMEHLDQAIAALDVKLSAEEIKRLEELYQPHPVLGHS